MPWRAAAITYEGLASLFDLASHFADSQIPIAPIVGARRPEASKADAILKGLSDSFRRIAAYGACVRLSTFDLRLASPSARAHDLQVPTFT